MITCISSHPKHTPIQKLFGFSLVEMAVVLVILGVLLGSLIAPISTQRDLSKQREVESQLEEIHRALMGFAAINGRLPCPATNTSVGQAAPNTATTACTQEHGFLPGRTLGLSGSYDNNNLLRDPWNNPLRYSLSSASGGAYSNQITSNLLAGSYRVCRANTCAANEILSENLVAMVVSIGKNGNDPVTSGSQQDNLDNDNDFVKTDFSEAVNNEFDDFLIWLSPNVIALETLRAGNLP